MAVTRPLRPCSVQNFSMIWQPIWMSWMILSFCEFKISFVASSIIPVPRRADMYPTTFHIFVTKHDHGKENDVNYISIYRLILVFKQKVLTDIIVMVWNKICKSPSFEYHKRCMYHYCLEFVSDTSSIHFLVFISKWPYLQCIVNCMAADHLVMLRARAAADVILTSFSEDNLEHSKC